jgi:hypothetical protein
MRGLAKRGSLSHNIPTSHGLGLIFHEGVKVWIETTAGGDPWFSISAIVAAIPAR